MGGLRRAGRRVDLQIYGEVLISLANATGRADRRLANIAACDVETRLRLAECTRTLNLIRVVGEPAT